jgi:hypothetical protein
VCLCVMVYMWLKLLPGSVSFRCSVPNNASQECYLKGSNFVLFSTLLFPTSTVINSLRRKDSDFLEYDHRMVSCIVTLLELILIQVMAAGTDSGLGFSCSLA